MKNLLTIAIIISALVIINEFSYVGETSLALVIIGLAASIILVAVSQLLNEK